MPDLIPSVLIAATALCLLAALPTWFAGHRAAALRLNGLALAIACAGTVLAVALNAVAGVSSNLNPFGLITLALAAGLAALCLFRAKSPTLRASLFCLASGVNLVILCLLVYLLFFFKIQF